MKLVTVLSTTAVLVLAGCAAPQRLETPLAEMKVDTIVHKNFQSYGVVLELPKRFERCGGESWSDMANTFLCSEDGEEYIEVLFVDADLYLPGEKVSHVEAVYSLERYTNGYPYRVVEEDHDSYELPVLGGTATAETAALVTMVASDEITSYASIAQHRMSDDVWVFVFVGGQSDRAASKELLQKTLGSLRPSVIQEVTTGQ